MKKTTFCSIAIFIFFTGLVVLDNQQAEAWTAAKRLTWMPGYSNEPAIVMAPDGVLHVIWEDDVNGNSEIYHKKSTNNGNSWTGAKRLTWMPGDSQHPVIATDSTSFFRIHIVWYDSTPGAWEIYYKRSPDSGSTWTTAKRLTWWAKASRMPVIALESNDNIHVVWHQDIVSGNIEIYYKRSANGGNNWTSAKRLTWMPNLSWYPDMAIGPNDHIHLVWQNGKPGTSPYQIYYKKSTDGGFTWTSAKRLTWMTGFSSKPAIAVDSNNNIHMVWVHEISGNWEIYYKKSENDGLSWTPAKRITYMPNASDDPDIAIDSSNNIYVVWDDNAPGNIEIYYKKGTDGGSIWTAAQRLTWMANNSLYPVIIPGQHVVWQDGVHGDGNFEIFHKRDP